MDPLCGSDLKDPGAEEGRTAAHIRKQLVDNLCANLVDTESLTPIHAAKNLHPHTCDFF